MLHRVQHAVKEVTGGFLPQNKADGIDNTLTTLIHLSAMVALRGDE